jgi:hypothetical protein
VALNQSRPFCVPIVCQSLKSPDSDTPVCLTASVELFTLIDDTHVIIFPFKKESNARHHPRPVGIDDNSPANCASGARRCYAAPVCRNFSSLCHRAQKASLIVAIPRGLG